MNDFYDIAGKDAVRSNKFQLVHLGEQRERMSFGKLKRDGYGGREYETTKVYGKVLPEDYDQQFASNIIRTSPPYDIEHLLNHHFAYYLSRFPENKNIFSKHIRYVIIPLVSQHKKSVYLELINEWLNQNSTATKPSIITINNTFMAETTTINQPEQIKVFISYSWDSTGHEDKVSSFTDHLRINGFHAQIDKMLSQEESAVHFVQMMHKSMQSADKVIIVLSAGYKQKAEAFTGGVGEEYRLVITDIQKNSKKYILVSFGGRSDSITPLGLQSRYIIDLSMSGEEHRLFAKLRNKDLYEFSEVGATLPEITVKKPEAFSVTQPVPTNTATADTLLNLHNGMAVYFFHRIASRDYKMRMADAQSSLGFPIEERNAAFKLLYEHKLIENDGTLVWATESGIAVFKDYNLYQSDEIFDGNLQFAILKFFYTLGDKIDRDSLPAIFADHAPEHSSSYSKVFNLMNYMEFNSDLKGYIKTSNSGWYDLTESGKAKYHHEFKKR